MDTKKCRNKECLQEKPIDAFPFSKNSADGYSNWCRGCHNRYCRSEMALIRNRDNKRESRKDPVYKEKERSRNFVLAQKNYRSILLTTLRCRAR